MDDRLILAISGGLDSMVMLHLFLETKFTFAVAHANFKLRGDESDGDEAFLRVFCAAKNINFYSASFETNNYAEEKKISIQMAARELRYVWFRQLMKIHGYSKIVTAHHADDQAETIFLNMVKGEGLNGLTGMPLNKRNVVRPLMFATKDDLEHFARNTHIKWREDSTNKEDNYHRNFIRHQIFPRIYKINPGLNESLHRTSVKAKGEMLILKQGLESIKSEFFVTDETGAIQIKKSLFEKFPEPAVLWRLTTEFGFSLEQAEDIFSHHHQSGKIFFSETHRLVIDREALIVQTIHSQPTNECILIAGEGEFRLNHQTIECRFGDKLSTNPKEAWLDFTRLKFPLTWRKWKDGDRFMPLGMNQFKKVSDFLIDEKLSIPEKESITVVESEGQIVWIVGKRIDDRYKISNANARVFVLSVK